MGLAIGARSVFVMMTLFAKDGSPRLVPSCTYPLTGPGCVDRVYNDLATFHLDGQVVTLVETFGITAEKLRFRFRLDVDLVLATDP